MKAASFFDIVMAIKNQTPLRVTQKGIPVIPVGIALESGNGRTWNVTLQGVGGTLKNTVFYNEDSVTPKFFLP